MNTSDVAQFLKQNPDFFEAHPDLLTTISVNHPHDGRAIPLAERQLQALRDKIRQLEAKFGELLRFGQENDEISEKVHRLALALLLGDEFDDVRGAILSHLNEDFDVPHVALRIWSSVLKRDGVEFEPVSEAVRFFAGDMRQPYCGAPNNDEVVAWFGEGSGRVRSVALIPLRREAQIFGMLALGSEESERFYPEMGTVYLGRIADMVATALRRQLG